LGASAFGPAVTALTQLVSVPVFLHYWGPRLYGEWLILTALPAYLGLSDLGFGNAAGNDMNLRTARGDREGALVTFQSTWVIITAISATVVILGLAGAFALPLREWLGLSLLSTREVNGGIAFFLVYTLLALQGSLILAGFRCDGHFATGILLINLFRLLETLVGTAAVVKRATPLQVAGVLLGVRFLATAVSAGLMLYASPWVRYGWGQVRSGRIRELWRPACAFMAFPAANALGIQGMVLVIGVRLGPLAVVVFSTLRTLTRLSLQVTEAIKNGLWPELCTAVGKREWPLARRLHGLACQLSLAATMLAAAFLGCAGGRVLSLWTGGRIGMDSATFTLLLLVVAANSVWTASSVVALATNCHVPLALAYLGATSISLVLAAVSTPRLHLPGAALSLLVVEFAIAGYVLRGSLRLLQEPRGHFLRVLLLPPNFGQRLAAASR
jgi:O-antigen/teichoic acid export membrane protein